LQKIVFKLCIDCERKKAKKNEENPVVKKGNKKESTYIKCWSNKKQKAEGGINQKIPMLLFS
jgi:hypothetical protein